MGNFMDSIYSADEAYLIGIANKGLYNRACKEYEKAGITINKDETSLTADFSDGICVSIKDTILGFSCSCPSRTICKHILMAILAAQQSKETDDNVPAKSEDKSFAYLLEFTPETLQKAFTKKIYHNVLFKINLGAKAEITQEKLLMITLPDSFQKVQFLPGGGIHESVCSCKSEKPCEHKAEAILHYMIWKTGKLSEEFQIENQQSEASWEVVPFIQSFLEEVFIIGLSRLSSEYEEKFLQLATLCHGAGLADFERICKTISGQLSLYFHKSAEFSKDRVLLSFAQLSKMCKEVEHADEQKKRELSGSFKASYFSVPTLKLYGMGAYPFATKSGFVGVTALFWSPMSGGRILEFTNTKPIGSKGAEEEAEILYRTPAPWETNTGWKQFSLSELVLRDGKLGDGRRLSSSKQSQADIIGEINLGKTEAPIFDNLESVLDEMEKQEESSAGLTVLMQNVKLGVGKYNTILQRYTCPVTDLYSHSCDILIPFTGIHKHLIENLERLEEEKVQVNAMSLIFQIEAGNLCAYPVAFLTESGWYNVGLDHLFSQDKKRKSKYEDLFRII